MRPGAERARATARFTDQEVVEIRDRAAKHERSVREEAEAFGVAPETIRKIIRRDTFTHLGGGGWKGYLARRPVNAPAAQAPSSWTEDEVDKEAIASQERLLARLAAEIKRVPQADALVKELQAGPTESAAEKIKRLEGGGQGPQVTGLSSNPLDE